MSGSTLEEPPPSTFLAEGSELAGYRLLGARSRGAMGIVYEAIEIAGGRRVAVKVLRARALRFAHTVTREREALAALSHPNIVAYVGHGETPNGVPYLVTEWLEGEDLEARLRKGKLDVDGALAIAIPIARALGVAHARGIVHRDVKPANIHLGKDGSIKLLDFGVAQLASRRQASLSVGTALYMAPEQVRAAASVDARADVYALGSVLFECLAGRPPFEGERTTVVLARTIFEPAPALSLSGALVSPALESLVARMLSKRPDERPHDGDEAADLLEACRGAEGSAPPARADGDEQRIGCVALLSAPGTEGDEATMIDGEAPALVARLSIIAEEYGVDLDGLFDGTFLVTASDVVPADQATRIGRFALAAVLAIPRAGAALATGTLGGTTSSALDRAEELLRRTALGRARVCPATRSLVEGRIALQDDMLVGASGTSIAPRAACVGRSELIRAILEPARALLAVGEAGIGKTCILHEIIAQRPSILLRGELHRQRSPLAPIALWLRRRFEGASLRPEIERLVGVQHVPAILRVAGEEASGNPQRIEESIAALLAADLRDRHSILLVDDAQWLDDASARVLEHVRGAGVAVVVFGRPEAETLFDSFRERVVIEPLDESAARELASLSGLDGAIVDRILDRAHGHPFVIRELARAAMDGSGEVPDTVIGIVQARLARLPDDARRVARVAALLGATFTAAAVSRVIETNVDRSERELDLLVRERIVEEVGEQLAFATPLLRDAAYELFTEDDRARAHAAAARWFDEAADRDPALVAWHAEQGLDVTRAARAYAEANIRALAIGEVALALAHARRGIACGPSGEILGELRACEADALVAAGELGEGAARAEEATRLLDPSTERWMTAMHVRVKVAARRAEVDALLALFATIANATPIGHAATKRHLRTMLAISSWLYNLGRAADADRVYQAIVARGPLPAASEDDEGAILEFLAKRAEHRNEWTIAIEARRRAAAIHARHGDRGAALLANLNVGGALGERGDLDDAIDTLGDVVREGMERGLGYTVGYARYLRARSLRRAGRADEAEDELTRALGEAGDDARLRGECHAELARLAIARGDLEEANERSELAVEHGAAVPSAYGQALAVRAEVLLCAGDPTAARAWSERAMVEIARELGDDPSYVWRVHLEIVIALGDDEEATSIARAARDHVVARSLLAGDATHQRAFLALDDNAKILDHGLRSSRAVP